jgi:molecular chaperone GrpE
MSEKNTGRWGTLAQKKAADKEPKQTAVEAVEREETRPADQEIRAEEPDEPAVTVETDDAIAVNEALIRLENEKEEYKNALIRERADFENYKKRNAALAGDSYKNGVADTATALLPVLDNFERALAAACADKAFSDGMAMILRQLRDALCALGLEEIEADGKFDPNLHNAVMQAEEEGYESNDIVETLQKGYRMKDRILRHAMVKVNK